VCMCGGRGGGGFVYINIYMMYVEATARQQVLRAECGQQVVVLHNENIYVLAHTHILAYIFCTSICTHTHAYM